jgi:hypothetical protein
MATGNVCLRTAAVGYREYYRVKFIFIRYDGPYLVRSFQTNVEIIDRELAII